MRLCLLLACVTFVSASPWNVVTELDAYVSASESAYSYEVLSVDNTVPGVSVHFLNMTSLTWFDESVTSTPVWWHYQTIVIPNNPTYTDTAILYVSGGDVTDSPPDVGSGSVWDMINVANNTGAVTCVLNMVPNQPLYFTEEGNGSRPRTEDAIIGYTWVLFIEENITDAEINALFPMTKAAKQAVDTLFDYVPGVNPALQLSTVVPTGFSKRGWTTWLLGCIDQRVLAMAPTVFDLLNVYENLQHHYTSLGGWSWAFGPYRAVGVSKYLHHPRTQILASYMDPLEYNERLTMSKLLSGATGDQFFLPDGTHYWWDVINGTENHYALFENDDHGLGDHRNLLWKNLEGFFVSIKDGTQLPEYTMTNTQDEGAGTGTITLQTTTAPTLVRAWSASTTNRTCEPDDDITGTCRRDFRLSRFAVPTPTLIEWEAEMLTDQGGGTYSVTYDEPEDFGFTIFHIEAVFPGPGGREFHLTSESNIIPDMFPYPICVTEEECLGELK